MARNIFRFARFCIVATSIPVFLMLLVNFSQDKPDHSFHPKKCSRFCHDKSCPHFEAIKAKAPESYQKIYETNILWLKNNPFGLSYKNMNLLLYVVVVPLMILLLLWGLIRKKNG